MKSVTFAITMVLAMFTEIHQTAAEIAGSWQDRNSGLSIQIYEVPNGIEVSSYNGGSYYYPQSSRNCYTDSYGDSYTYRSDDDLIWEDKRSRRKKRFKRKKSDFVYNEDWGYYGNDPYDNGGYGNDRYGNDGYGEYGYGSAYGSVSARQLEGRWTCRGGDVISISARGRGITVRKGWRSTRFRKVGSRKFRDDYGNTIKVTDRDRFDFYPRRGRAITYRRARGGGYCE